MRILITCIPESSNRCLETSFQEKPSFTDFSLNLSTMKQSPILTERDEISNGASLGKAVILWRRAATLLTGSCCSINGMFNLAMQLWRAFSCRGKFIRKWSIEEGPLLEKSLGTSYYFIDGKRNHHRMWSSCTISGCLRFSIGSRPHMYEFKLSPRHRSGLWNSQIGSRHHVDGSHATWTSHEGPSARCHGWYYWDIWIDCWYSPDRLLYTKFLNFIVQKSYPLFTYIRLWFLEVPCIWPPVCVLGCLDWQRVLL